MAQVEARAGWIMPAAEDFFRVAARGLTRLLLTAERAHEALPERRQVDPRESVEPGSAWPKQIQSTAPAR
jgi:hypothetical protein